MRQLLAWCTVAMLACGGAVGHPHGYLEPETRGKMRIVDAEVYISTQKWQQSPYFRIGSNQVTLPVFVLIDQRGMGCVVPPQIWALSPQYAACPTGWLHARPHAGGRAAPSLLRSRPCPDP